MPPPHLLSPISKPLRAKPEFSLRALRAATGFLTILPVLPKSYPPDLLPRSAIFFPFVGAIVGAFGAAALLLTAQCLPIPFASAAALLTTIVLTGALHEDGLADTADGLFGGLTPGRRLEIMRDSRIGTFGAIALFFSLLVRWSALATLAAADLETAALALVIAHAFGRLSCIALAAILTHPPNSPDHKSGRFIGEFTPALALPSLLLLTVAGLFAFPSPASIFAPVAALSITPLTIPLFKNRLGGINGDCLGAANQLTEVTFYLALLVSLPHSL